MGLEFFNGPQDGAINSRWEVWQPNVGFGSTMRFGHCVVSLLSLLPLRSRENATSKVNGRYGIVLVSQHVVGLYLSHNFILLIHLIVWWLQVSGPARSGMVQSSNASHG